DSAEPIASGDGDVLAPQLLHEICELPRLAREAEGQVTGAQRLKSLTIEVLDAPLHLPHATVPQCPLMTPRFPARYTGLAHPASLSGSRAPAPNPHRLTCAVKGRVFRWSGCNGGSRCAVV